MKKAKFFIIVFLIMFIFFAITGFISGYFSKRVTVYVNNKATVFCNKVIEEAIREEVVNNIDLENLVYFNKASDGTVKSVYINTKQVNTILSGVNKSIASNVEKIKKEKLQLPLGIIFSETLFYDLGPELEINIIPVGSAITDLTSTCTDYGINSSLLQVSITVKMMVETIIPLKKGSADINFTIPLIIQVINSDVPRYYYNTNDVLPFINYD